MTETRSASRKDLAGVVGTEERRKARIAVIRTRIVAVLVAGLATTSVGARTSENRAVAPREIQIPVGTASLYARVIGKGRPIIVLHGGPDFDHSYLLPDLDRLADAFRLIYYDQRGRGRSADGVKPENVTLQSDLDDLDAVRQHYRLEAPALLGHSWGVLIALEYALQHPHAVSRLILMNPAPVSLSDLAALRQVYVKELGPDAARQKEMIASPAYQAGDPEAVTARYRIHFKHALARQEDYERLMDAMHAAFIRQGPAGIVESRAVEDHLYLDTWSKPGYDLLPRLAALRIPTLVIWGDYDFIPVGTSAHITAAIQGAKMVTLTPCGHFSYLECPADVRRVIQEFFSIQSPDATQAALNLAAASNAYVLSDPATWIHFSNKNDLQVVVQGDGS